MFSDQFYTQQIQQQRSITCGQLAVTVEREERREIKRTGRENGQKIKRNYYKKRNKIKRRETEKRKRN